MVDFTPVHPLGDLHALARSGPDECGITITVRHGLSYAQVFAKAGKEKALTTSLKIGSQPSVASETAAYTALPLGPREWMMISKKSPDGFAEALSKKVKSSGFVSNQSDSRVCFRVAGPRARDLMNRGCRLDLHPSVTKAGFCAQTPMAQVGVLLHQSGDQPIYDLHVYSGFALSFWNWLTHTADQFGCAVVVE